MGVPTERIELTPIRSGLHVDVQTLD